MVDMFSELTLTDQDQEAEGSLVLTPESSTPMLDQGTIDVKSTKFHLGLGDKSPGKDVITSGLVKNNADSLRTAIAAQTYSENEAMRRKLIYDYASNRPEGELQPGEREYLQSLSTTELSEPVDILEKRWAEYSVTATLASDKKGDVDKAEETVPDMFDQMQNDAVDRVAINEFLSDAREQVRKMAGVQDYAEQLVPFWGNYQISRAGSENLEDAGVLATGDALREQAVSFHLKPYKEQRDIVRKLVQDVVDNNENALAAEEKLGAFQRYGKADQRTSNSFFYLDGIEFAPGGLIFDPIKGLVKGGIRYTAKQVGKASMKQVVEQGAKEVPSLPAPRTPSTFGADYDPKTNQGFTTGGEEFSIKETPITSSRNGESISARLVRGDNGKNTVEIDPARLQSDFDRKAWTTPRVEGVEPFADDTFETVNEWREFLIQHEVSHIDTPRGNLTTAQYENVINQKALMAMGKAIGREITDPVTGERIIRIAADTPANRVNGMLESAVDNGGRTEVNPVQILETNGDLDEAALQRIVDTPYIADPFDASAGLSDNLARNMPGFVDPNYYLRGSQNMSKTAAENFVRSMRESTDSFLKALYEGVRASRVTIDQLKNAEDLIRQEVRRTFHGPNDAVLDAGFRVVHESENFNGINYAEFRIGRPDGTFFDSAKAANDAAVNLYHLTPGSYNVPMQQGNGFYILARQMVDETLPGFQDLIIDTPNTVPTRYFWTHSRFYRSADAFGSKSMNEERLTATLNITGIQKYVQEATKNLGKLSKKQATRLEQVLEHNRDFTNADGTRGYFFKTVGQLETHYKNIFGKYPTEAETAAYFTYRSVMDYDYLVRNGKIRMEKSRMGIREITMALPAEGSKGRFMQDLLSPVEGKFVDDVLEDGKEKRILIVDSDTMENTYVRKNVDGLDKVKAYQDKGYKLVELANPNARPLMNASGNDNLIQYALVNTFTEAPPSVRQLPYREGGHVVINARFKASQARFITTSDGDRLYMGDRHLGFFSSEKEAGLWATRMEKARKLLLAGDMGALRSYIADKNLPYSSAEEFKAQFAPRTVGDDPEPIFDINSPFVAVGDRLGVNDVAKTNKELQPLFDGIVDTIDDATNSYRLIDKKFAGEKSDLALTISPDQDAVWKFDTARHISPMKAMQDAVANAMRSSALENVQIKSVENFIQQFSNALDVPMAELRRDPMEHFLNPKWNRNANPNLVATAKGVRLHTLNLLGMKSPGAEQVDWVKNKVMSSIYDKLGKTKADYVDEHMLPYVKDYSTYMRAIGFHSKMGFLNPVQLFIQANGLTHSIFVTGNPLRSTTALAGATMMMTGQFTKNADVMRGIAKAASKMGWKQDEFLEMWRIAREQSIDVVGGEVADLSTNFQPKVVQTTVGRVLDAGTVLYRNAERLVQLNGWATAYKEFRSVNPNKVVTSADIKSMLKRADILTVNMRNASNAAWQQGIFSIPTQFSSYSARLTEQIYGKALTGPEKARVVAMYSLLYGVPGTVGALTLYPIGQSMRQYALENGYDTDSNIVSKTLTDGVISMGIESMTGTKFNVGQRTGPGAGLDVLRDIFRGDKTWVEVGMGPSGTISYDLLTNAFPLMKKLATFDFNSITEGDVYDAFKEVSTISNLAKLIYAHRTQKHLSKNTNNIGPMNSTEAWYMFTTGLTPQRESNMYLMQDSIADMNAAEQDLGKMYKMHLRRAELATDDLTRELELRRAHSYILDVDPRKVNQWNTEVLIDAPMLDKTEESFVKSGPMSTRENRATIIENENN